MLNWDVSREDAIKINLIAKRASMLADESGVDYPVIDADMDLTLAHNDVGLDLDSLAEADDSNFAHDVFGIRRHLDREVGKIVDAFLPRHLKGE